jgi:hypothetical protein
MLPILLSLLMNAHAGTKASSTKDKNYASTAVDGLLQTAWIEDASGHGKDEWLELDLGKNIEIKEVSIWPGNLTEGIKTYRQYARPKIITVVVDGNPVGNPIRLLDKPQRLDIPVGVKGKKVKIVIDEVFEGTVFADLAITEISINFSDNAISQKMEKWAEGKEGQKLRKNYIEEINKNYQAYKAAEFGDKEAFTMIGTSTADGAPYYRKKVKSSVSDGFRIQALPSDRVAQKALEKIGNPNAIPYFELAALRSYGKERMRLQNKTDWFRAHGDLIGGPNRNVRFWGESGWSIGELQSFGEPMAIELNQFAELYIADIGNNRIQIFNDSGRPIRQHPSNKPGLTEEWYKDGRPWYVSGVAPGNKEGQFVNPVDVVIIPGKEGDGFATLDANGRVQLFDLDGRPLISWTASPTYAPEPLLGGTAYLVYLPKKEYLCTILQDEGICFNQEAEELTRWTIKDGTPNAVEVLPNDKILMAFGSNIVSFDYDGFRDRVIIDESILGKGFESLDITLDDKNKLWIVTDRGIAYKFKRPGKLDYKIQAIDRPLKYPRIAVIEDQLYILSDDQIELIDIRQRKLDLAEREE